MANYICDLCGWQSEDPAAVKDHMHAEHGVAIENAAIVGSIEQDDGLLILRDQDGATAVDMGAWLGAQLAKLPRGPAPADIDTLTLTTAHAASSYGRPVAVIEGAAYGPEDMTPAGVTGAELVTTWAAHFLAPLTPQHETAFDGLHAIMAKLRRLSPDERVSVLNAFDNILGAILWRAPAES